MGMSKPAFVEVAEKDMDFKADRIIKDLCDYADKDLIEYDFIFEIFLRAFRKKVNAESEEQEDNTTSLISKQTAIDAVIEWYGCEPRDMQHFLKILAKKPSKQPDLQDKCDECFYANRYGTCNSCMRNYPDRYSPKQI